MRRLILPLAFFSSFARSAKLEGLRELQLKCLSILHSPLGQKKGKPAFIGYRGLRGPFAFASRTAPGDLPVRIHYDLEDYVYKMGYSRKQDQDLHFALSASEILLSSIGTQNVSAHMPTSRSYATERKWEHQRGVHLDHLGFLLRFEMPKGSIWDQDEGFHANTEWDTEIKLDPTFLEHHDPIDLVYKVRYNQEFLDPEDPKLPQGWQKDLRDLQRAVRYLANLEGGFSGEQGERRIRDYLAYVKELRAEPEGSPSEANPAPKPISE